MDFSEAKWIGKRRGECPSADAKGDKAEFIKIQKIRMDAGMQEEASLLGRKEFIIKKAVNSAVAHVVGLGYFELYINGKTVGDRRLSPGYGDFFTRIPYYTIDVTEYLQSGKNALAFELGNGWFLANPRFNDWRTVFYGNKRFILRMDITYADGTADTVLSDENFKLHDGAVTVSSVYDGEEYDANLELPGWKEVGFDDSAWQNAAEVEHPGGELTEDNSPAIRVISRHAPIAFKEIEPRWVVYSFAQNLTGNMAVWVCGKKGDRVTLRYAENLNGDGTLDQTTNGQAYNTDRYILKGEGIEKINPRFTYHCFRYAEIRTYSPDTKIIGVLQQNIRSDVADAGIFKSGDAVINMLHDVFRRSQTNCMVGIPVDCPQRDERLGWLADAYTTAETVLYNFNAGEFYRKYIKLVADMQRPDGGIPNIAPWPYFEHAYDWAMAFPYLIHFVYKFEGDKSLLSEYFDRLMLFRKYVLQESDGYRIMKPKYGDWYSPREDWKRGDPQHLEMYFFVRLMDILKGAAEVLGRKEVIKMLEKDRNEVVKILLEEDYDSEKNIFTPDCAVINAFAVLTHLLPEEKEIGLVNHVIDEIHSKNNCLYAGIFGVKAVFEMLELYDRQDVMDEILHATDYPSYRELLQGGRSTLPEKWNHGGSGCHAMFDTPDSYFYTSYAGIRINRYASEQIIIKPWLNEAIGNVNAKLRVAEGEICVSWMKTEEGYSVCVDVPCDGAFFAVHPNCNNYTVTHNGKTQPVHFILNNGRNYIELRK